MPAPRHGDNVLDESYRYWKVKMRLFPFIFNDFFESGMLFHSQ
jgi:hypothetical protein